MPKFNYIARDNTGKIYKGSIEALDASVVSKKLAEVGLYLNSAMIEKQPFFLFKKHITNQDLVTFSQQLADLIGAGIPLLKSLSVLERQVDNYPLKNVIKELSLDIEAGNSFSESLAKYPKVFSEFFIGMVKAGETGGVLAKVLDRLAMHLERRQELTQKVKSAFAYPVLVSILACMVVTFLLIFIVPIFSKVYRQLNIVLPGPTLTLIFISMIIRKFWWALLAIIFAFVFIYTQIKNQPGFRDFMDSIKIKMPIFGKLNRMAAVSRFIRTLGDMLASGIQVLEALGVAEKVVGNRIISNIIFQMKLSARSGNLMSQPLENQKIFPPTTVQLMMAGEESGTLDKMLEMNANSLDRDIDTLVKRIITVIEPALTAMLAAVVGFIAMAVYLPMFDLIQQISRH